MIRLLAVLICFAIASCALTPIFASEPVATNVTQKAVLVTGASTGIGRKLTERLAADGYWVYAGARKDSDLKQLGAIKNVQPLRLDVTNLRDIAAALQIVSKNDHGLYALVNNAGIASFGSMLETAPEEFEAMMKVNLYGPYHVTRAFAPLLIASKGRITNIGSISGILSEPGLGPYQMTKHAIESFTDVLAEELAPAGVLVNMVDPGSFNSEIARNGAQRTGMGAAHADRSSLKQPDEVVAAIELALFEPAPKRRYMVTPSQVQARVTIEQQLAQLTQLNEDQTYTYDRDALVTMLDAALAKTRPHVK